MRNLTTLAGLIALGLACTAQAAKPAKPRPLIIDVPSALADAPSDSVLLASARPTLTIAPGAPEPDEPPAARFSPKEFLNHVKLGTWKWDNGTALQLTGDRFKLSYGEKTRFNLTLRPFKDDGTINFTINRGF